MVVITVVDVLSVGVTVVVAEVVTGGEEINVGVTETELLEG